MKSSSLGKTIDDQGATDYTGHIKQVIDYLGIDVLAAIGGDDTLSYSVRLHKEGIPVVTIPKGNCFRSDQTTDRH